MKKVFSVVMTFLLLLIMTQQGIVIVYFKLNQQAIEQKFCINKSKPELECHGKCHLKKELEKTDNTDWESIIIFKSFEIVLNTNYEFLEKPLTILKPRKIEIQKELYYSNPHLKIFIPPPDLKSFLQTI